MDLRVKKYQDHAISLRNAGYNCAQCTLMAICSTIGMKEKHAARMASPFGFGFSDTGEICGALSILGIAEGLLVHGSGPEDKAQGMWSMRNIFDKFKERNNGHVICRELKVPDATKKCPDIIREAIELFFESHPELVNGKPSLLSEIKKTLNS